MSRPKIAVDIDDVLADNATGFIQFSNAKWGTSLKVSDYDEHWTQMWGVSDEETSRRRWEFFGSGAQRSYAKVDGAHDVLLALRKRFDLCIVTSRHSSTIDDTLDWVHKHYNGIFTDETIHFAGMWDTDAMNNHLKTKADMITSIGANYLIDDQLKHCQAVAQAGHKAVLFGNYGWNQTDSLPAGVARCVDWSEVKKYFDGQ